MDKEQITNTNNNNKINSTLLRKNTDISNNSNNSSKNNLDKTNLSNTSNNFNIETNFKKNNDKLQVGKKNDLTITEEIAFLRIKNLKLREKNKTFIEKYEKSLEEKLELNNNIEKINLKLLNEKIIRKQTEQQLLELFTKETENKKIKENLISENEKNKILIKNHEIENEKNRVNIKKLETEISEIKSNVYDINNNNSNLNRKGSITFSSETIEIKRDSFSINSQNLKNVNEDIQNNFNFNNNNVTNNCNQIILSKDLCNNKNINLINGINLNSQIEENFFKNNSNLLRENYNVINNKDQLFINQNENFNSNSFNSPNIDKKIGNLNEYDLRNSNGNQKL